MDEELRYCTLSRASLWNELNQDDLDNNDNALCHIKIDCGTHISDLIEGGII